MAQVGSGNGFSRPHPWLVGGHRQTIAGYWCRRLLRWTLPAEDVIVEADEDVRLLLRATWQPGPRSHSPALLTVHGLGGSDASPYVVSTGRLAFARGWHVLRMNMRGAGDGEALCPRLYDAGLDLDLLAAV
ncbi:MAG TPA: alpha/beta hydrolase, partial [Vicinamibacteria bacterium]